MVSNMVSALFQYPLSSYLSMIYISQIRSAKPSSPVRFRVVPPERKPQKALYPAFLGFLLARQSVARKLSGALVFLSQVSMIRIAIFCRFYKNVGELRALCNSKSFDAMERIQCATYELSSQGCSCRNPIMTIHTRSVIDIIYSITAELRNSADNTKGDKTDERMFPAT